MPARLPRALLLALSLPACAPGFTVDRHRLGPPRIAALGVVDGELQAALWSGRGLYHDAAPRLRWLVDGVPVGEGFGVRAPTSGLLRLEAEIDGEERVAELSLPAAPAALPLTVRREELRLGDALALEQRRGVEGEAVEDSVAGDADARLVVDGAEGRSLRWMVAGPDGGVLELDATRADLLRHEVLYDDGLISRGAKGPAGVYTALVLAIDGEGSNRWRWVDVGMGAEGPLLRAGERLLPVALDPPESGLLVVRFVIDDEAGLLGLRVDQAAALPADDPGPDPLPCAPAGRPLRLDDLAEGRCTRADIDGQDVVLELQ
ncbi:MAG: hypothetical protein RL071_2863 [Pseudomonadota bacterium]